MRQTRDDKRLAKLQQLSAMLAIADKFGGGQQTAEQLQVENLRGMQQERQQRQALLPFMLEQQQMQNDAAQQSLQFAQQQQPLQLQQLQEAISAMGLERQFNEGTQKDRMAEIAARAAGAQIDVQFAKDTFPARKEVAMMEPKAKGLQMDRDAASITSQKIVDEANRQQILQGKESFPAQLAFDQARIQGQTLENQRNAALYSGMGGGQPQAQTQMMPSLQNAVNIDKKLQAGIFPQPGSLEGRNQLEADLNALVTQMRTNPGAQWSPQANNIRAYFDNGGVPLSPGSLPTMEELLQLLAPVQGSVPPAAQLGNAMGQKSVRRF